MEYDHLAVPPRLFEVSRNGAYELTMPEGQIHPESPRKHPWLSRDGRYVWLLLAALTLGVILLVVSGKVQEFLAFVLWLLTFGRFPRPMPGRDRFVLHLVVLLGLVAVAGLACLMYYSHTHADHEPVEFVEGISIWPTECLRLAAVFVACGYLVYASGELRKRNEAMRTDFSLPGKQTSLADDLRNALWMWKWKPASKDVSQVWQEFEAYGHWLQRLFRCTILLGLCGLLLYYLWLIFDPVFLHARGSLTLWMDRITLFLSGAALFGLLVVIADTTILCYRLIRRLSEPGVVWPDKALEEQARQRQLVLDAAPAPLPEENKEALRQWLLIRFVADATNVVARSIYYPFVVLLILIIAQNRIFTDWHWNIPFILVALLSSGGALTCAVLLQHAARRARERALEVLDRLIRPRLGIKDDEIRPRYEQIRTEIENMESGAFATFTRNPIVGAILIPLGGGGGLAALQALLPYF
jgi:hypothetical protein